MTPDRWRQINELFEAAMPLASERRLSYLAQACGDDVQLKVEVEKLLAGHDSAKSLMQTGRVREAIQRLADDNDESVAIGHDFGPYRVLREIGRGGMGRVFLAERADREFHKQVAVKLIKRGMDTDSVVRRFRNEREILASLQHPNIGHLLDGGTSENGLPYFVMEYIEGQPIDAFCDQHRYSIAQRLQLFRRVCDAVIHAHQHLVIHCDIKPSNILVSSDGNPKLLDFGIARLLVGGAEHDSSATVTGFRLLTPEYASPEQILGQPPTTVTDVYSLGVVLYKLLAGVSPYAGELSFQDLAESITRIEPSRPSLAVRDSHRRDPGCSERWAEGDRVSQRLEGDLDNIVLMALRREPNRRYQSVEQFSEDIRRHLESLPVLAREDTLGYRVAKFTNRHRPAVAAGAVAVLILIGGIFATTVEAHRAKEQERLAKLEQVKAERRFNDVRKLARTMLFDYHDAIKNLPGATLVRQRLVRDALQYLDSLAGEASGDRSLLRELASAYERVSDVQGGTLEANLGNTAGAIESAKKALQIRIGLIALEQHGPELRRELASSYGKVGTLLWETGDIAGADRYLREAIDLRQDLVNSEPTNVALRGELSNSLDRLGMLLLDKGEDNAALTHFRRSLDIYGSIPAAERATEGARRAESVEYEHIGSALLGLGDLPEALKNNSQALAMRAALVRDFPLNSDHQRTLEVSYYNQGEILDRMGRTREALESYRNDVALAEKQLRIDSSNEQSRGDLAYGLVRIGDMLFKLGTYTEAVANYRRSEELRAKDVKNDTANLWKRSSLIEAKAKICKCLSAAQRSDDAEKPCSDTLALIEGTPLDASNSAIRSFFADTYSDLAQAQATLAGGPSLPVEEKRRRWNLARGFYLQSLQIWDDLENRKILAQADRAKRDVVSRELARCDTALIHDHAHP